MFSRIIIFLKLELFRIKVFNMADKNKSEDKKVIDKMDKEIMVIRTERLFGVPEQNFSQGRDYFEGFRPANEFDYTTEILKYHTFKRRGDVENDVSYKQPIAYTLIVNPGSKKVFVYQRAEEDKKYIDRGKSK